MTNPLKGQIKLTLAGTDYNARLNIDAIVQIEQAVGCGIIKLANKMAEGDIAIGDMLAVLLPALRGGGNDFQMKDVTKIVQEAGIVPATTAVANLMTKALTTHTSEDDDPEKKPEEPIA
tara:strand:+ start:3493 stop:3849 length:357 start_codon:yes stop_codon:yes gene_type:complete